ncbi:MAG: hypothetical protein CME02_10405 [Geminicoccus sp.]|nr:hypothetical protein [Geminicoccus sp.]
MRDALTKTAKQPRQGRLNIYSVTLKTLGFEFGSSVDLSHAQRQSRCEPNARGCGLDLTPLCGLQIFPAQSNGQAAMRTI